MTANPNTFPITTRKLTFPVTSIDALRAEIRDLGENNTKLGAVYFRGRDEGRVLVIFAGDGEKYAMLSVARNVSCDVIIFQDSKFSWYHGSDNLPDILSIAEFLEEFLRDKEAILLGQSSGGYAALAVSRRLKNSKVVAISPQTFSDFESKGSVYFSKKLKVVSTPGRMLDLREHLADADISTRRAIIVSSCEVNNPYEEYYWLDHLHAFRMIDLNTVEILIARSARHPLAHRKADIVSEFIASTFEDPEWAGLKPFLEAISENDFEQPL